MVLRNTFIRISCIIVFCFCIYFVFVDIHSNCHSKEVSRFYISLDENWPTNEIKSDSSHSGYTVLKIQEKEWSTQASTNNLSICLATHGTIDHLKWLKLQVDQWQGIISVAVFVPPAFKDITIEIIQKLVACSDDIGKSVSFTLVFENSPYSDPVELREWQQTIDRPKCPKKFDSLFQGKEITKAKKQMKYVTYPQNMMRNLARKNCPTTFSLNVDIDMIPSNSLSSGLDSFFKRTPVCTKCAFVTPVYEIEKNAPFPPKSKTELLKMIAKKKARRYHITISLQNQGNSKLGRWEDMKSKKEDEINILYNITKYEEFWEPILILHQSAPGFEESFAGYGFTRNSHVFHLHVLEYQFYVLDNAFLSHKGFQEAKNIRDCNREAQKFRNRILYYNFRKKLLKSLENVDVQDEKNVEVISGE